MKEKFLDTKHEVNIHESTAFLGTSDNHLQPIMKTGDSVTRIGMLKSSNTGQARQETWFRTGSTAGQLAKNSPFSR